MQEWVAQVPFLQAGGHRQLLEKVAALRGNAIIYPLPGQELYALRMTPFSAVQLVILGQDPYHGPGQAQGLAFSVPESVPAPPSLRNIFKEIREDVYAGEPQDFSTDLTRWARQGVLLLNTVLTVEAGKAGSHRSLGWQVLTDALLTQLSQKRERLVFMLWGARAQAKLPLLAAERHLILTAPHPSPLAAWRGFFGCRHFSQANAYLAQHGGRPIVW
ncbi:MAG TPA: uracil-DNA glycosylase [Thermoflexia bacterium]|nr:uracil-DNA glycosylase [Thermoflexia bacterium]